MSYWYAAPFGDDSNSGRSFGRAKRSIQAAIDLAADDETVRVYHGAYHEALTISRPLEVVVYRPSKAWGAAILEGPGDGAGLTVSGLSGTQSVRFIGFRMAGWETGVAGANAGGILTAYGLHFAPGVSYGINPSGLGSARAWSCTFEEQLCALGGADALQAEIADARGCTFFDCARSIAVGDDGVLCRWRNCIMANAGAAVRHVELDQRVAFEADFNLYAGARPSAGWFVAGGVDYATDGDYDARWTAFQDIHSPPRNGEAAFVRTVV
jgi:hypothetical protein